jgi:hypothetical protein
MGLAEPDRTSRRYSVEMITPMAHPPDLYEDVTQVYLRLIRKDSPHAAVHIAEIIPLCGAAAALRAAVILAVIKIEVRQDRWIPGKSIYASLIEDHPAAIPALEAAIICCLQAWGVLADVTDEWTRHDLTTPGLSPPSTELSQP